VVHVVIQTLYGKSFQLQTRGKDGVDSEHRLCSTSTRVSEENTHAKTCTTLSLRLETAARKPLNLAITTEPHDQYSPRSRPRDPVVLGLAMVMTRATLRSTGGCVGRVGCHTPLL
jgi:hypothetical protein